MSRIHLYIAASAALAGCAVAPSQRAVAVHDADARMVESCAFLGDVQGTSGVGGLRAGTGIENAKNEARDKAAQLGATNIVWGTIEGGMGATASGKAYQCR